MTPTHVGRTEMRAILVTGRAEPEAVRHARALPERFCSVNMKLQTTRAVTEGAVERLTTGIPTCIG